jgi:hypothetical protein
MRLVFSSLVLRKLVAFALVLIQDLASDLDKNLRFSLIVDHVCIGSPIVYIDLLLCVISFSV